MASINKINKVVLSDGIKQEINSKIGLVEFENVQIDNENKFNDIYNNLGTIRKPPVPRFNDLATVYPNPVQGWLVKVEDGNGISYQYDETDDIWYPVTLNPIPNASDTSDGLLKKEDKAKLDGIELGAQKNLSPEEMLNQLKIVDGHESGLDADTLDGRHGDEFASALHNHDGLYYKKNEVDVKVNSKAAAVALTTHVNDSEKHITLEDRIEWDRGIIKVGTTPPESGFLFWLDTNSEN